MDERDMPWVLGKALQRAYGRCVTLALSESLLGYYDSARVYEAMADELDGLASWVLQYKLELVTASAA